MSLSTAPRISPRYWLQARAMQALYPRMSTPRPELYLATREVAPHTEERVATRHGKVRVLVYQPPDGAPTPGGAGAPRPVYVNLHGGGFFGRYPEQDHHIARYVASEVGAVVVSVDYDVVPQVTYPVPEHEAYDVTKWVHDVAGSRGWDPARITVGGQSAGGKLALNVAQQAYDAGEFRLAGLVSLFGAADISRDDRTSPLKRPLVPHGIQSLVLHTLGVDAGRRREALASPYYDRDLAAKVPPTLIETGADDTLGPAMDELADRLAAGRGRGHAPPLRADRPRVHRFLDEVVNGGNLAAVDDLWTADLVWRGGSLGEYHGLDAYKAFAAANAGGGAFTGMHLRVEQTIAADDIVVVLFTNSGTHTGPFLGNPATGRYAAWLGTGIYRIADGRIAEGTFTEDILSMFQQLGITALPAPAAPSGPERVAGRGPQGTVGGEE